jgi:hypothetical protein
MTMATAVRNVGVSLVIATGNFAGTKAVTAATALGIFQKIVMVLVALGSAPGRARGDDQDRGAGDGGWIAPKPFMKEAAHAANQQHIGR